MKAQIKLPTLKDKVNNFVEVLELESRKGASYEEAIVKASAPYTAEETKEMADYITKRIERMRGLYHEK